MNTSIGIITGLLGGSLGTLLITKITDYFSERRVFKRELKRQFDLIRTIENHYAILKEEMKQVAKELIECIDYEKRKSAYLAKIIREELKKYET